MSVLLLSYIEINSTWLECDFCLGGTLIKYKNTLSQIIKNESLFLFIFPGKALSLFLQIKTL